MIAVWLVGAIIVTGAAVRVSGSGLGCPDWPACQRGSLVPTSGWHGWIESLNRYFTGAVSVAIAVCVLGSLARSPRRRDLTRLSLGLVGGVMAQAILGGITVKTKVHPAAVAGHYLLSIVLLINAIVLVERAKRNDDVVRRFVGSDRVLAAIVGMPVAVILLTGTGVTGSGPHSGDEKAHRFSWLPSSAAKVHSVSVWLFLTAVVGVTWWVARHGERSRFEDRITFVLVAIVGQGMLGYIQYFSGVPAVLALAHVAGSVLVASAATLLVLNFGSSSPSTAAGGLFAGDDHDEIGDGDGANLLLPVVRRSHDM